MRLRKVLVPIIRTAPKFHAHDFKLAWIAIFELIMQTIWSKKGTLTLKQISLNNQEGYLAGLNNKVYRKAYLCAQAGHVHLATLVDVKTSLCIQRCG